MSQRQERSPPPIAVHQLVNRAELVGKLSKHTEQEQVAGHIFVTQEDVDEGR